MARANPLDAWTAAQIGRHGVPLARADLVDYQLRCLRASLAWAQGHSPFYRSRLTGFDVASLDSLDALCRLPLTSADDLRRNAPPLLALSQSAISHVVTLETSGTSGPPKRVFFTPEDQMATLDFFAQGMRWPVRAGDRVLIFFPGERPGSVGDLLARALTRLGATPIPFGWPHDLAAAADALRRERPAVVAGVPLPTLAVARSAAARSPAPLRVRSVLLSADHVAGSLRRSLAALWGCEIFEHYGMTEMGLGGGVDCLAHGAYHMRESELLIEVIDPASGVPVAAGEWGEVVFTTLTRRGMPLIRYRTGDFSRQVPGPCVCGSPLLRLERIARRLCGGVVVGESGAGGVAGELTMAGLDEALLAIAALADFAACFAPGTPPTLTLTLSPLPGADRDALAASARAALAELPLLAAARRNAGWRLVVRVAPGGGLLARAGKRTIDLLAGA